MASPDDHAAAVATAVGRVRRTVDRSSRVPTWRTPHDDRHGAATVTRHQVEHADLVPSQHLTSGAASGSAGTPTASPRSHTRSRPRHRPTWREPEPDSPHPEDRADRAPRKAWADQHGVGPDSDPSPAHSGQRQPHSASVSSSSSSTARGWATTARRDHGGAASDALARAVLPGGDCRDDRSETRARQRQSQGNATTTTNMTSRHGRRAPTWRQGLGELDHRPEPAAVNSPAFDRASSASSPTPSDIARLLASDADDDDDDELADGYSGAAADDVMAAVVDAQSDEDEYRTLLRKATERVAEREGAAAGLVHKWFGHTSLLGGEAAAATATATGADAGGLNADTTHDEAATSPPRSPSPGPRTAPSTSLRWASARVDITSSPRSRNTRDRGRGQRQTAAALTGTGVRTGSNLSTMDTKASESQPQDTLRPLGSSGVVDGELEAPRIDDTQECRGVCTVCGLNVLVTHRRVKTIDGQYLHQGCSAIRISTPEASPRRQRVSPAKHSSSASGEHGGGPFETLPDELLVHILDNLTHREKLRCGGVCRLLRRIAADTSLWTAVDLAGSNVCDDALGVIGLRATASMSLEKCHGVTPGGLGSMLTGCGVTLRSLNLRCCQVVTDAALREIASHCRALESIDLSWCGITDKGVVALCGGRRSKVIVGPLAAVHLQGCAQVTDTSVVRMSRRFSDTLRTLDLFGCYKISADAVVEATLTAGKLTTLCVAQCSAMSSEALVELCPVAHRFTEVDLRGCRQLSDNSIAALLRNCSADLQVLRLSQGKNLSDVGLAALKLHEGLQVLDLKGCSLVRGIESLQGAPLRELDLSRTALTDDLLGKLTTWCPVLTKVNLNNCVELTGFTVALLLQRCRKLQSLDIRGCTGIPTARARELVWLRPEVVITSDFPALVAT